MLMMPVMVFGQRETIMTQDTIILYGDTIIIHEPWDRTMHDPWYPMGFPDDYVKEPTFEEKLNSLLQEYKQYCKNDTLEYYEGPYVKEGQSEILFHKIGWEITVSSFSGFIEWMENKTKNK